MPDYFVDDSAADAFCNEIKNNVDKLVLCDAAPANYSDANTNNGTSTGTKIAERTVVSGDFTIADNVPDGRKVSVAANASVAVVADGDGTHVAYLDTSNTKLVAVTKLSTARGPLTVGDNVQWPEHAIRVRDSIAAT